MPQRFFSILLVLLLLLRTGAGYGQPTSAIANTQTATCGNSNGSMTVDPVVGGTPPYSYQLQGGTPVGFFPFQASNNFSNLPGGNYTLTIKDFDGGVLTINPVVGNIPGPTITALTPTPASCLNNDGTIQVAISGGTATFSYALNIGAYGSSPTLTSVPSSLQTISVKDGNGCVTSGTVTVPLDNNLSLTVGGAATICEGSSTPLQAVTNASSYAWAPATGLSDPGSLQPTASPTVTTVYTINGTLGICAASATAAVTVLPAPVADAGPPLTTCFGKSVQLQGSGGVGYQWLPATLLDDPIAADPTVIQPPMSLTYSLNVVGADGCPSLTPSTVLVTVLPPYKVFAGDDTSVVIGQSIPLQAVDVDDVGYVSYVWSPSNGLSDPVSASTTASFSAEGTYTYVVTATAANGCEGVDTVVVKAFALADILVPNAFTPNNDGHNDVLRVLPVGIKSLEYFTVFNRFGQQVFTTVNSGIGWDGSFSGHQLPTGTYVWMAGGVDYSGRVVERKGTVILIR